MADVDGIQFFGAAGTVTGSKHLVTCAGRRVLLDCGMFQGLKALRLQNWAPFPFPPEMVDDVVLSHAHIDHSGALPRLVRQGYRGPIHCTEATADLLAIMLRDAAYLQEEQAAHANRHRYSKHDPALPLYTMEDTEDTLGQVVPHPYTVPVPLTTGAEVVFRTAGHILGSATIELRTGARRVVFSGDLGRWDRPILRDPVPVPAADVLLLESTYGDRVHPPDPTGDLAAIVRETAERGGTLVMPAFAVGRTQELLWRLRQLEDEGRIPVLPVYVDSPMAINVTGVYRRHPEEHDLDMRAVTSEGVDPLRSQRLRVVRTVEESKSLNDRRGPIIIISASGMATGGRVLHHLKRWLPDRRTCVLLIGFQAAGTRGRALLDGATSLRIHGAEIPVRARVATVNGLSAHADRHELLRWLDGFTAPPDHTYLVHGEPAAAESLATAIRGRDWACTVAQPGQRVPL